MQGPAGIGGVFARHDVFAIITNQP